MIRKDRVKRKILSVLANVVYIEWDELVTEVSRCKKVISKDLLWSSYEFNTVFFSVIDSLQNKDKIIVVSSNSNHYITTSISQKWSLRNEWEII